MERVTFSFRTRGCEEPSTSLAVTPEDSGCFKSDKSKATRPLLVAAVFVIHHLQQPLRFFPYGLRSQIFVLPTKASEIQEESLQQKDDSEPSRLAADGKQIRITLGYSGLQLMESKWT
ncbi:hypothetical protein ACH5RR_034759 [Cinchona calisaya]|uniref:Uncharacterized protein n=1 Tax=Cinchona calisaya TaxID=153742 RepID=A0ABD2YH93_9GENT